MPTEPYGPTPPPSPAPVDMTREYLAAGPRANGYFLGAHALTRAIDDVTRAFGPELYEFMLLDAAVAGSISKIRTGVLCGRVHLVPTVKTVPGRAVTVEMTRAEDVAEDNRRNLARLIRPIEDVLGEMIYALCFGNKVAEVVEGPAPVDGRRVLRAISPKPWWSWRFGVDAAGNTLGVIPAQGLLGLSAIGNPASGAGVAPSPDTTVLGVGPLLDPRKFPVLAWDCRGGDPRGNSLLRPCYPWWNEKRQSIPDYRAFIKRLATPKPVAIVGDPGQPVPAVDPVTLAELPGQTETMLTATLKLLQRWDNNQAVALPGPTGGTGGSPGTTLQWYKAENDGKAFTLFYDFCDRMIHGAILQSARAVMEAEHGSKADATVAQEGTGSIYRFIGAWLGRWLKGVLYRLNVENFGPEAAAKYTPEVAIGEAEHQDFPGTAAACAAVGYTADPSQFAAIDAMLNLPEREAPAPGEDDQAQADDSSSGGDAATDDA